MLCHQQQNLQKASKHCSKFLLCSELSKYLCDPVKSLNSNIKKEIFGKLKCPWGISPVEGLGAWKERNLWITMRYKWQKEHFIEHQEVQGVLAYRIPCKEGGDEVLLLSRCPWGASLLCCKYWLVWDFYRVILIGTRFEVCCLWMLWKLLTLHGHRT